MSTPPNPVPQTPLHTQPAASVLATEPRPFYWSVRRELWEVRSLYIAPLAAAVVYLLGFSISTIWLPGSIHGLPALDPMQQLVTLAMPYAHAGMLVAATAFVVGVFYCLEALHGERRDRSILFWKSLPVSDLTTVLSKFAIPFLVLPLFVFVITLALEFLMLLISIIVLSLSGTGAATLLSRLPIFQMEAALLYSLVVIALWQAPVYAWLLLISAWARRATFLWAALPLAGIMAFETVAFRTTHFASLLGQRLFGFAPAAFNFKLPDGTTLDAHFIPLSQFTPGRFLASPGLWLGLLFAAAFLAGAVRLRRSREPM